MVGMNYCQRNVAGIQIAGLDETEIKHCQYVHAFNILRAKFLKENGLYLSKPTFKSSVWVVSWTMYIVAMFWKRKGLLSGPAGHGND